MTVERSYLNRGCRHMSVCDSAVPDTRLQAIADAWAVFRSAQRNGSAIDISIAGDLLWLLLDALTEEDD